MVTTFLFALFLLASVEAQCASGRPKMAVGAGQQCGRQSSGGNTCCPDGYCCSQYGWCGTASDFCAAGCQSGFGKCNSDTSTGTTTKPPTSTTATTTPPTTTKPPGCGNCVTKQMLININKQSSWWGNCDSSQPAKANPGGKQDSDGYYCSDTYVNALNEALCTLGYCTNLAAKRVFIGQVIHETAYFTKFYQPLDKGRGALHMLPSNVPRNIDDMQALWPAKNPKSAWNANPNAETNDMLSKPQWAWYSAAAWFLRTNAVIPNCNKNLFLQSFEEASRCVFGNSPDGGLAERRRAFDYANQYIVATSASENASMVTCAPSFSLLAILFAVVLLLKRNA